MKHLLIAVFVVFTTAMSAQIDVKINPIGALFGSPDVSAEYLVSDNFSIQASFGLELGKVTGSGLLGDEFEQKKSGYNFRVMGKYYFSPDQGADNFYVGLYTGPRSRKITSSDTSDESISAFNYKVSAFTAGLAIGKKWVADSGLVFEVGFGAGRAFGEKFEWEDEDQTGATEGFGVDFIGTIALGYRFGG